MELRAAQCELVIIEKQVIAELLLKTHDDTHTHAHTLISRVSQGRRAEGQTSDPGFYPQLLLPSQNVLSMTKEGLQLCCHRWPFSDFGQNSHSLANIVPLKRTSSLLPGSRGGSPTARIFPRENVCAWTRSVKGDVGGGKWVLASRVGWWLLGRR